MAAAEDQGPKQIAADLPPPWPFSASDQSSAASATTVNKNTQLPTTEVFVAEKPPLAEEELDFKEPIEETDKPGHLLKTDTKVSLPDKTHKKSPLAQAESDLKNTDSKVQVNPGLTAISSVRPNTQESDIKAKPDLRKEPEIPVGIKKLDKLIPERADPSADLNRSDEDKEKMKSLSVVSPAKESGTPGPGVASSTQPDVAPETSISKEKRPPWVEQIFPPSEGKGPKDSDCKQAPERFTLPQFDSKVVEHINANENKRTQDLKPGLVVQDTDQKNATDGIHNER